MTKECSTCRGSGKVNDDGYDSDNIVGETKCPVCNSVDNIHAEYVDIMFEDQPDYLVCNKCDTSFDADVGVIDYGERKKYDDLYDAHMEKDEESK